VGGGERRAGSQETRKTRSQQIGDKREFNGFERDVKKGIKRIRHRVERKQAGRDG
jgi:hypothetical protein